MVCHKLVDMSKPVVGPGSDESHPQDDEDSQDHTAEMTPLPFKTSASAPGNEFSPDSSCTGKDSGANWHIVPAISPKRVYALEIM